MSEQTETYQITYDKFLEWFNSLDPELNRKERYLTRREFRVLVWCKMKFLRFLWYGNKQPQHIDDLEGYVIKAMRQQKLSYEDIGFALDRSKASIYDYCQKNSIP